MARFMAHLATIELNDMDAQLYTMVFTAEALHHLVSKAHSPEVDASERTAIAVWYGQHGRRVCELSSLDPSACLC